MVAGFQHISYGFIGALTGAGWVLFQNPDDVAVSSSAGSRGVPQVEVAPLPVINRDVCLIRRNDFLRRMEEEIQEAIHSPSHVAKPAELVNQSEVKIVEPEVITEWDLKDSQLLQLAKGKWLLFM